MFDKLVTDGFSVLQTYVNSPTLGRNQSALHIAVKSNTAFPVAQLLNAGGDPLARDESGNTPGHLAAQNGCHISIDAIFSHDAIVRIKSELLSSKNTDGDTVLHTACKAVISQFRCVTLLIDHGANLRCKNNDGYIPIQCAVLAQTADVSTIDAFLEHDHSLISVIDDNGNGLLHLTRDRKVIACLMHHGITVEILNYKGETALHSAALKEYVSADNKMLDIVVNLIMHGVDVNIVNVNGDTALHCLARLPTKKGSNREAMTKALIVLGADLNMKNRDGNTVYEVAKKESCRTTMTLLHSVGADDTRYLQPKSYGHIDKNLIEAAKSDKVPRVRKHWDSNSAAVLALDGGGIRGLVLVQILLDLERRSKIPSKCLFDWIGGTSTGSLLTLGLIYEDMNLRDIQRIYFTLKDEIFKGTRPYDTEVLESFMMEQFGTNNVMSSKQFPRCVVPATVADCRPCKLHVFKNYGFRVENDYHPPHLQKVWEVTRASSAAPTYFTPYKKFVDGGMMANNPTITMLTEMHECNMDSGKLGYGEAASPVSFTEGLMRAVIGDGFSKRENDNNGGGGGYIESRPVVEDEKLVKDVKEEPTKPFVVVSLGTGLAPEVMVKDYNVSKVGGALGAGRFLLGIKEFAETLVEQCAATDGAVVMGAKAWCESIGSYYFRFQPQLTYNMLLDEKDNRNLIDCLWDVQCFVYNKRDQFEKVTDILMSAFTEV